MPVRIAAFAFLVALMMAAAAQWPAHAADKPAAGKPDAGQAHAGDPNAAKGIVAEMCVKCHDVPRYGRGQASPAVAAPPFQAIADDPDTYGEERIRAFLAKPHFPMAGFTFSPSDIDNLVAFIRSLRRK